MLTNLQTVMMAAPVQAFLIWRCWTVCSPKCLASYFYADPGSQLIHRNFYVLVSSCHDSSVSIVAEEHGSATGFIDPPARRSSCSEHRRHGTDVPVPFRYCSTIRCRRRSPPKGPGTHLIFRCRVTLLMRRFQVNSTCETIMFRAALSSTN